MQRLLITITKAAERFFAVGAGLSMALMFSIVFINALRRYTLGKSFEWGEELPVYLAIFGVMFGCALGYLHDRHVRLAIFIDPLPASTKRWIFAAVDLVMTGAGGMLAYSGWLFAARRGNVESSGLISTARDLAELTGIEALAFLGQMYPWQFAMCFGGAMISLAAFLKFLERISGETRNLDDTSGELA
ncbi:MAG: TRAP transporter small permease subunit [Aquisalinus sp.]|nr:TRAP transporter small permease subunit [Aquisalinus sp.]